MFPTPDFAVFGRFRGVSTAGLVLSVLLFAAFPAAAAGIPADGDSPSDLDPGVERGSLPDTEPGDGPLAVFAAVEEAWSSGDAEALVRLLDPDEKVRLVFERGGPLGGWFNRDQAFYLLTDMFEFLRTDLFRFERYWNLEANGRSPYAVAVREFHMNDGVPREDQVFISLRRTNGAWTVGEIRTVDR